VAAQRKSPVIELTVNESGPAGSYTLLVPFADAGAPKPDPDDVALVLHTSGTTSRPKIVPLRQRNLAASARNIAATLALTPQDRCHHARCSTSTG
jgi:oxalate---CoA ligase